MTPIISKSTTSRLRRGALGLLLLAGTLSNAACVRGINPVICEGGRTAVDGVCASNKVADYVACVRAQGATLDHSRREGLSAELGYLQAKVGGAYEMGESLKKKYQTTDRATLSIVEACNARFGIERTAQTAAEPDMVGRWAGTATEYGRPYPVRITVGKQAPGRCAVIEYPSLGCAAVLHCAPSADGQSLRGVEQVVKGRGRCASGGKVTIANNPNGTLSFLWKGNPRRDVVTASLHRDMMP